MLNLEDIKHSRPPLPPFHDTTLLRSPLCLCYSFNVRRPCFSQIPSPFKSQCGYSFLLGAFPHNPTSFLHKHLGWMSLPESVPFHILSHQNLHHFTYLSKTIIDYEPLEEYVLFTFCSLAQCLMHDKY